MLRLNLHPTRAISRWLKADDEKLLKLYDEFGPSWSVIATKFTSLTAVDCQRRVYKLLSSDGQTTGNNWQRDKDGQSLVKIGIDQVMHSPFRILTSQIPTFKSRWQRPGWMYPEKWAIWEGVSEHALSGGSDGIWHRIAKWIPRRTADQCRRVYTEEVILHADSGIPEVEECKRRLFPSSGKEISIKIKCKD